MSDVVSDETTLQIAAGKRSGAPDAEDDSLGQGTKKARTGPASEASTTERSDDSAGEWLKIGTTSSVRVLSVIHVMLSDCNRICLGN